MNYVIGEILRSFREYKNLSIEDLAEGICTKDELILFEGNKEYPRVDVLCKIAERLNIDISYFFNLLKDTTNNYSTIVIQLIEKYKRERDYHAIQHIVLQEQNNPLFGTPLLTQFLKWHEGICTFYLQKDLHKAVQYLNDAISITNPNRVNLTERETEILNSIAILYYDYGDYTSALPIFLEAQANLDKLPDVFNSKIWTRVLFGLSQTLTELHRYEESLVCCHKGIKLCINQESLYCFNEFYYQAGENYVKLGNMEKGKEYFEECIHLLKLENKTKIKKVIEKEINNLLAC